MSAAPDPRPPCAIADVEGNRLSPVSKGTAIGGGIIAAMVALASATLTEEREGYSGRVYLDPAKIATQCFGETVDIDPSRIYSREQCAVKLRTRMARDYAPPLLACVPELKDPRRVKVAAAMLDAAYNAGPAAVCRSPMAQRIRAGWWTEACHAFPGWYVTARDRRTGKRIQLKGLVLRRQAEMRLCLEGATL